MTVSWFRTSEWGVSRHRNSVSQVIGIAGVSQPAGCRSVVLSSPLCWPASRSPRSPAPTGSRRAGSASSWPATGSRATRRSSRCRGPRPTARPRRRQRSSSWSWGCASSSPTPAWTQVPTRSAGTWPTITPPPCPGRRSTGSWCGPAPSPRSRTSDPRAATSGSRPSSPTKPGSPTSPTTACKTAPSTSPTAAGSAAPRTGPTSRS